jgi:2,4-dichlorophenol 6-monooxygenase
LLATYGVKVLAISKYPGPASTPRSTLANARSMEVYRDLGIEDRIKAQGVPMQSLLFNVFATAFNGLEFARYRSYGTGANRLSDYAQASPCRGWNIAQHCLEPVLLETARERGAEVRYSNEMLTIEQSSDHIITKVRNRANAEEYLVRARYAIGADGGRSTVVEQTRIPLEGAPTERTLVSIWLEADLSKYAAHRPAYIFNMFRPGPHQWFGAGTWLCVRPYNEWLFSMPGTADVSEELLLDRARLTINDPSVQLKVKKVYDWRINHIYAKQFRSGRIFISGDAAHRHPPAGGLGANTSIQDAFNLAWKLAFVLSGKAGDGLLDSYHDERQPIGQHLVERANKSMANNAAIPLALGWSDDQREDEGWARLETLFEDTPEAAERRSKLDAAVALGHFRSNALGMELGQRYNSCAVVSDGTPFPAPKRDSELYYEPTTHPGCYLPHAWIEHGNKEISTLDVVGRGRMCLVIGLGGAAWAKAVDKISSELGVDLAVCQIGKGCEFNDLTGEWAAVSEIGDHGALLVRPDRWIAWRACSLPAEPAVVLAAALKKILALN